MGVFLEPPFWSQPFRAGTAPHAVSTLVTGAASEPLPLADAKIYARVSGTNLDAVLPQMLTAARQRVQRDTGIVLLTETYDISFDTLPTDRTPIVVPWRPVQAITSLKYFDSASPSVEQTLDVSNYELDPSSEAPFFARVALAIAGSWPTDVRPSHPYVLRIVAGWDDVAKIPRELLYAVGTLFDILVNKGPIDPYEDAIAPFRIPVVA
jgi:uncharacterized phiE125 gp8 family phage protein